MYVALTCAREKLVLSPKCVETISVRLGGCKSRDACPSTIPPSAPRNHDVAALSLALLPWPISRALSLRQLGKIADESFNKGVEGRLC
jgi:hypothetical protein